MHHPHWAIHCYQDSTIPIKPFTAIRIPPSPSSHSLLSGIHHPHRAIHCYQDATIPIEPFTAIRNPPSRLSNSLLSGIHHPNRAIHCYQDSTIPIKPFTAIRYLPSPSTVITASIVKCTHLFTILFSCHQPCLDEHLKYGPGTSSHATESMVTQSRDSFYSMYSNTWKGNPVMLQYPL